MENCPFKDIVKTCTGSLSEKSDKIGKLKTSKGITGINKESKKRGIDLVVEVGMRVHNSCRQKYTNTTTLGYQNIVNKKIKTDTGSIPVTYLRSKAPHEYKYSTHCIFCEKIAVDKNGKKWKVFFKLEVRIVKLS